MTYVAWLLVNWILGRCPRAKDVTDKGKLFERIGRKTTGLLNGSCGLPKLYQESQSPILSKERMGFFFLIQKCRSSLKITTLEEGRGSKKDLFSTLPFWGVVMLLSQLAGPSSAGFQESGWQMIDLLTGLPN